MPWQELWIALALVMVIEGIMPFLNPRLWREALISICQWSDQQIRMLGLGSMLCGLIVLYWVK